MFSKVEELILKTSQTSITEMDKARIQFLITEDLNWGDFLYLCAHHRVIPLVWRNIKELEIAHYMEKYVRYIFENESTRIEKHNQLVFTEIDVINQCFEQNDVKAVLLKGAILAPHVYKDVALREFHDVDYLVGVEDLPKVTLLLNELGYIQGHMDVVKNKIIPISKEEKIFHRMNTHELIEFLKLTNCNECKAYEIDINFEVSWKGHKDSPNKYNLKAKDLIAHSEQVQLHESKIYSLLPEYQLIQLCAHLYSEAVYFCFESRWLRDKFDLNLIKFCDIHELVKMDLIDWDLLLNILENDSNLKTPIYYSLCLLNTLYFGTVPDRFLKKLKMDHKILDVFYNKNGKELYWNTSFIRRMFSIHDKVEEIKSRGIL